MHLICHGKTQTLSPHAPQTRKPDHLPHLLSQASEVDITKGICWHFPDMCSGVPFLSQEDGRFGSIFQVLFSEVATLTHDPPGTHIASFAGNQLKLKGKAQLGHPPQPRQEVLVFSLRTPEAPAFPTQPIIQLKACTETKVF